MNENTEQIDISSLKDTKPQKKSHKKAWIAFFVVVGACAAAYGGERSVQEVLCIRKFPALMSAA